MNYLAKEKSPYLKMHSDNPVDWYPWGQEAFHRAKKENKPILLSIGYSACHWCHVIGHESFEDEEIAQILNEYFISVKVDKEERPDIDTVYMDAVQIATGSGGWPMTLLLTPDKAPFFAGTYLTKPAMKELLEQAAKLWQTARSSVIDAAENMLSAMKKLTQMHHKPQTPEKELLEEAVARFASQYDTTWGGFGTAPKFPSAHNLLFLLEYYNYTKDNEVLEMVEGTLEGMYRGGIFDHIGGGFCRYSVDEKWLIPHFEKMLYDNALLLWAYAKAWHITQKPLYKTIARHTADYILREMTGREGQFYSTQDADSEGVEGAYYTFTQDELLQLLGEQDGNLICRTYGIDERGNFEGKSIPNLLNNKNFADDKSRLTSLLEKIYQYRKNRFTLNTDDKILTSWNSLMITALSYAAEYMDEPHYIQAACASENFICRYLMADKNHLLLRYRDGEAKGAGVLSDHAYYALSLCRLFETTGTAQYLEKAQKIAGIMLEEFADNTNGGFYLIGKKSEQLITSPKDIWDGAMPSGNSIAVMVFQELVRHTGAARWREAAERQISFMAGAASRNPTAHGFTLFALTKDALK